MSHFASADCDAGVHRAAARAVPRRDGALRAPDPAHREQRRHVAPPCPHLDAVRCGIAVYGISPFGTDPADDGLAPGAPLGVRRSRSSKTLAAGESTGYGRRFVATEPTRIGIVPVGYADGFRRDMTGTEVVVAGERARSSGTVSMDALAVVLPDAAARGERRSR